MKEQTQNQFIIEFKSELDKIETNNEYLINREIREVELYANSPQIKSRYLIDFNSEIINTNSVFNLSHVGKNDFFNEIFNEYILYGSAPNSKSKVKSYNEPIYKLAIEFAEYYKWLNELKSQNGNTNNSKKSILNHEQKMLALFYLGLDLRAFDNTKAGYVISQILDLNEDNTRKALPKLYFNSKGNDVRTKANFMKLMKLFKNPQFDNITEQINEDIKALK